MKLEKHTIWSIFPDAEDLESFQQKILEPLLPNPLITDDIRADLEIINKLLLHSYYEYEFIDIALIQAVFTLEKALKIRYKELHGVEYNQNLQGLIEWFFNNGYFETWNKEVLHSVRKIRNGKVHEIKKTLGGIVFVKKVYQILDAINDIYESATLRVIRKEKILSTQNFLIDFCKGGAILSYNNLRYIVFNADIVFINNKSKPEIFYLVFWPIFDPKPFIQEEKRFVPNSFSIRANKITISENSFQATEIISGENLYLTKIQDEKNRLKYIEWEKEINPIIVDGTLNALISIHLNDQFDSCLKNFYSQELPPEE